MKISHLFGDARHPAFRFPLPACFLSLVPANPPLQNLFRNLISKLNMLLRELSCLVEACSYCATNRLFGLSRFEVNPVLGGRTGLTPGARLTLGKRISKELSVTYSTNVSSDPNQILTVEYRVSDRLSFVAQYEQASTRQLSSRSNIFNFEIRFRKRF